MAISATIEISGTKELLDFLTPQQQKKVVTIATNKAAKKVYADIRNKYTKDYTIKKKDLQIKFIRATASGGTALLRASYRQRTLERFKIKVRKKTGVYAEVKRGTIQHYPHAFRSKGMYNNKMIFQRVGEKRLPIKPIHGISVGALLKSEWARKAIDNSLQENYEKILWQSLNYFIKRNTPPPDTTTNE